MNRDIDFATMQRMQRFARYWDMIGNSGRFTTTRPVILGSNPFWNFLDLSDWLFQTTDQTSRISLSRLFLLIYLGSTQLELCSEENLVDALAADFARSGEKGRPPWRKYRPESASSKPDPVQPATETGNNSLQPAARPAKGQASNRTVKTRQARSSLAL